MSVRMSRNIAAVTKLPQVRVEVTGPCAKDCLYCRPGGEGHTISTRGELSPEQLARLSEVLVRHGLTDFKLTGGDPMLRTDIVEIVTRLKALPGIERVDMVTRDIRAGVLAESLRLAGLDLLNFSIDSLDPDQWMRIVRHSRHDLAALLVALNQAVATGIKVRINTVLLRDINEHEIDDLLALTGSLRIEIKFLEMIRDIPSFPGIDADMIAAMHMPLDSLILKLRSSCVREEVMYQPGGLGHPNLRFTLPNGAVALVKSFHSGAWYSSVHCSNCDKFPCDDAVMALRVTPTGALQFCLARYDLNVDLWSMMNDGTPTSEIDRVVDQFLKAYQESHFLNWEQLMERKVARNLRVMTATRRGVL